MGLRRSDLTMKGSTLCECCCGPIRTILLAFLKKGGPISLNSLMIVNTKLTWNEDCDGGHPSCSYGAPVYGYSLGFGQVRQFQCPAHREAACGCGFPLTSLHAAHTA